jgi:hypothetical protein
MTLPCDHLSDRASHLAGLSNLQELSHRYRRRLADLAKLESLAELYIRLVSDTGADAARRTQRSSTNCATELQQRRPRYWAGK